MQIAGVVPHSFVDGPGIRYVVFFQGCNHNCPGCHNPETHDIFKGETVKVESILKDIGKQKFLDGITLSGGDPILQPREATEIAKYAHDHGLNVWCYTGYTYEQLISGSLGVDTIEALRYIDVLVDGSFVESKKPKDPLECIYRGSTNQRLIDIPLSLKSGKAIEYVREK